MVSSNNTNKLSPQEQIQTRANKGVSSNNTNKLSPQELIRFPSLTVYGSNNTNKLSPQEPTATQYKQGDVQIIQINLVLKNYHLFKWILLSVQIIQINLVLKNASGEDTSIALVQIIQINLVLKNCRPYYSTFMLYLQYILSISIIKC